MFRVSILSLLFMMLFITLPFPALALEKPQSGSAFSAPDYREMVRAVVGLGGFNIQDEDVFNEYARVLYCGLYKEKFRNDFNWNDERQKILERSIAGKEKFRSDFEVYGSIRIDRYDFSRQLFPLTDDTKMVNLGAILLLDRKEAIASCTQASSIPVFPASYSVVLKYPLSFTELKMPMDDANILVDQMEAAKNVERKLYVRFRLHLQDVASVERNKKNIAERALFNGELVSMELFLDQALTRKFMDVTLDVKD